MGWNVEIHFGRYLCTSKRIIPERVLLSQHVNHPTEGDNSNWTHNNFSSNENLKCRVNLGARFNTGDHQIKEQQRQEQKESTEKVPI